MDYQVAVDGYAKVLELPHYEDTPEILVMYTQQISSEVEGIVVAKSNT